MPREWLWFAFPIVGLLSQLGGTFKKQFRRIGIPSLIVAIALLFNGWSWWLPLVWGTIFFVTTLPFTLLGESVHDSFINWIWVVVYSALMSLSAFPIALVDGSYKVFLVCSIVSFVAIVPCFVLSNIKKTSWLFRWKFVEGITWAMAMYPALQVMTLQ